MKLKCLTATMVVALTSVNVMAQNVQSYQSQPEGRPAQAVKNPPVRVYQAPRPSENMQVAEAHQPSAPTEGDIIDVNGNLKFVPRAPAAPAGSSAAVEAAAAAAAEAANAAASKANPFDAAAKADASGFIHPRINPESTEPTLPELAPLPAPAPHPKPVQQPQEAPAPQVAPEPAPAPVG